VVAGRKEVGILAFGILNIIGALLCATIDHNDFLDIGGTGGQILLSLRFGSKGQSKICASFSAFGKLSALVSTRF